MRALRETGLPVETASGGRTKFNRAMLGVPKTHALDALCMGHIDSARGWRIGVLRIRATGRGSYCRTRLTRFGFPRGYLIRIDVLSDLKDGDSFYKTATPRRENVTCCIDIPIQPSLADTTTPFSYSKTCDTFGATECTALRAGLG